jgi:hypothetical protein
MPMSPSRRFFMLPSRARSKPRLALGPRKGASQAASGPDQLRSVILAGYDRDQERVPWQDGEAGRLERAIQEIAVEVVSVAEVIYREGPTGGGCS